MSDMMAVLLGAGSGKAAQVLASLGGKQGTKGAAGGEDAAAPGEGGDPFLAILFDRMEGLQSKVAENPLAAVLSEGQLQSNGAESPMKPLKMAMLHAQADPAEMAYQQALTLPVAITAPMPSQQMSTEGETGSSDQAGLPVLAPRVSGQSVALVAREVADGVGVKGEQGKEKSSAESADDGQLLPPGKGLQNLVEASGKQDRMARFEGVVSAASQASSQNAPGQLVVSVAHTLAGQGLATGQDAGGVPPGQTLQSMPGTPGMGPSNPMMSMAEGMVRGQQSAMQLSVDVPLRSPQFPQELGERVVWLSSRQGQVAEIALQPSHLGPMEVKLSLAGGEATAQFYSPHASVREVIESALPRLREMLAEAGVNLGQTQVRDEALPRQSEFAQADAKRGEGAGDESGQVQAGMASVQDSRVITRGLVDLYI